MRPRRARFAVDREDLLELFGNSVDNACRWAKTRVRVTVGAREQLHIVVEDDGPGVASDKIASLARRGARLDEAVQGHGLGLAIAAEIAGSIAGSYGQEIRDADRRVDLAEIAGSIAGSYGGALRFDRSALGGLAVAIDLPLHALA